MPNKASGVLLDRIEQERHKMYKIASKEPHNTKKILEASQRLDKLIFQCQRQKICCCGYQ